MKNQMILFFMKYRAVAENAADSIFMGIGRCPLASTLFLTTVIFYGIAFFFALEQSIIMLSNLAKLEIMVLIGFPTLLAVLSIIVGTSCGLNRNDQL